jgi:hypothetical protein
VYAFIDANERGGVGVVFVKQRDGTPVVKEVSTSVTQVFSGSTIPGLDSRDAVLDALAQFRDILAQVAGLYYVIDHIAPGTAFTLVHAYNGLAHWMQGRWQMKDALVREIIGACQRAASARRAEHRLSPPARASAHQLQRVRAVQRASGCAGYSGCDEGRLGQVLKAT